MNVMGIEAVSLQGAGIERAALQPQLNLTAQSPTRADFSDMIMRGLHNVDARIDKADTLVRQFAVDDTVPVHHVTMALEEARLSVELAMQVRARLVEGYRELMNMQI